ncbi:Double-stranded RNA-binding protein 4 [Linum grandiflorum]
MYKNLLQERAQRGGGVLPVYETRVLSQGPSFISTVALEGYVFSGLEAKSKKVAEMSAAKAAYTSLTEVGPLSKNLSCHPRMSALLNHPCQANKREYTWAPRVGPKHKSLSRCLFFSIIFISIS